MASRLLLPILLAALAAPLLPGPAYAEPPPSLVPPEEAPQVVVAGQWPGILDPFDVGFTGLSTFTRILTDCGFDVNLATAPLEEALGWTRPGDVLVLTPWLGAELGAADRARIDARVRAGMGLLVLGDHINALDTIPVLNPLLQPYGMAFLDASIEDPLGPHGWTLADFPLLGVADVLFPIPGPMEVSDPARVLARSAPRTEPPEGIIAAEADVGAGRVIAIDDLEFLFNGEPVMGLAALRTRDLVAPLFARLSNHACENPDLVVPMRELVTAEAFELAVRLAEGASLEVVPHNVVLQPLPAPPGELRWDATAAADGYVELRAERGSETDRDLVRVLVPAPEHRGDALLLLDGHARTPHGGASGLLGLARALRDAGLRVDAASSEHVDLAAYDALLLGNPVSDLGALPTDLEAVPQARFAVLAEPWTSVNCPTTGCGFLLALDAVDPPRPLDAIAAHVGARVSRFAAWDDLHHAGHFEWPLVVGPRGEVAPVWRAGSLQPEPGSGLWDVRFGDADGWGDVAGVMMSWMDDFFELEDLRYEFWDVRQPRVLLANDDRLASADVDPYTNLHLSTSADEHLVAWAVGAPVRREMTGRGPAGFQYGVSLRADSRAAAATLAETLPPGFRVDLAPGAEIETGPSGTRLTWRFDAGAPIEAGYAATTPLVEGWFPLAAVLQAGATDERSEAALRLQAPRLEFAAELPARVLELEEFSMAYVLHNAGDGEATQARIDHNVTFFHGPAPDASGLPPSFGDPPGALEPTATGWSLRWDLPVPLAPGDVVERTSRWSAPAVAGAYPIRMEATSVGPHGVASHVAGQVDQAVGS